MVETKDQILNPSFCNLGSIINKQSKCFKNLYVPKFQRDYSWEEKDVTKLLNNILDSFENNENYYFIGTVQLTDFNGDEEYAIIDGQQRLITLLLIIKCLTKTVNDNNINVINIDIRNNEQYQKYYNEVFTSNNLDEHFNDNNLYYKNYKIIEKYLCERDDDKNTIDFEKKLLNYIFENLYVIVILSAKQPLSKIIKIFDTLNTTGMDLNSGDLFKIKFAEYLMNGDNSKYEETIDKISKQYQRITELNEKWKDEKWSIDEVLLNLQHILIANANLPLSLEELKKGREKFFEDYFANNKDRYLTFSHFETLIDVIYKVVEMRHNNSLEFKYRYAQDILFWTRYWRCWSFPYVAVFYKAIDASGINNISEDWIKNIFKNEYCLAEFLTVYSTYYGRYINDVYKYYIKLLMEVKNEIGNNEYFEKQLFDKLQEDVDKKSPINECEDWNIGLRKDFKEKLEKNLPNYNFICKW